ncbi:MAG: hydrogenase maturation protease [Candidatus Hinthialibacter antarcticus]|nr:hydrogenase maturation protease [Candidatus Hinthialibacter antarcticus]
MSNILVLGYGNPLRGDDGIGWIAASQLKERNQDANVAIQTCHQLTPEWAEEFSQYDLVILIDADAQGEPGEIKTRSFEAASPYHEPINHFSKPETILAMARELYGKEPRAYIVSIVGETFGFQESLSPKITALLPELVDSIELIIRNEAVPDPIT